MNTHMPTNTIINNSTNTDDIRILGMLLSSSNKELADHAAMELATRVQWNRVPPSIKKWSSDTYFNGDVSYYICSFGGCGSKMLQTYLSHFGNTFHIHSRTPPKKLSRVGTVDQPEWFNDIEVMPVIARQIPIEQSKNIKVIYIYRDPIYAIHSRIIPGKTHRISTDHLNNIGSPHWNIESVVGNMMDLWQLEEFFDNYTSKDEERNYQIHCVNYDKFWTNIELFNETMGIPTIPALYPIRRETSHDIIHADKLEKIYGSLIKKMNEFPPVFIV